MAAAPASPAPRPVLRIGGASGFWGDSSVGAPQLVNSGLIDVLVFDYLAETTMAILAGAQRKNPAMGYATDFVDPVMREVLATCVAKGIKVVSNAGGINPQGCADALARLADELGVALKIAVVDGDDVRAQLPALAAAAPGGRLTNLNDGQPLPTPLMSANAYLGAEGVARALAAGADVVITGRCVDSAVTLGPLIHHFGWAMTDHDRLAGGSLAGHIIECGCQATGGLFTDWREVPDWAHIGYPIVEVAADGSFVVTKVPGTGGLVSRATVAEQMLYEIGDPGAYLLPDVSCDFREVRIEQLGDASEHRVSVRGARGYAPPPTLKVSATALTGWRVSHQTTIVGMEAGDKARRTGECLLERTRELLAAKGFADFSRTHLEVIGTEALYGPHATTARLREVFLRLTVVHAKKEALEVYVKELAAPGTSWSPGTTGGGGGRPAVSPLIAPCAFLVPRSAVAARLTVHGQTTVLPFNNPAEGPGAAAGPAPAAPAPAAPPADAGPLVTVPLVRLAWGRSGDKGNSSNIGLIARRPEYLPWIWQQVTPEAAKAWLAHLVKGGAQRWHLPGIGGLNILLQDALDGGGPVSLRLDALGKGMAQMLLEMPVQVPEALLHR